MINRDFTLKDKSMGALIAEERTADDWHTQIKERYKIWVASGARAGSIQIPFGAWWEMEGTKWRVSWIESTGELYATEPATDRFIILGRFSKKRDIAHKMQAWFGGDNLDGLIHQMLTSSATKKNQTAST